MRLGLEIVKQFSKTNNIFKFQMCQKYYGLEFVSLFYFNLLSPISPQIYPKFPVTVWRVYVTHMCKKFILLLAL